MSANPTAEWAAQQIIEAFPNDEAPRYILRDRDGIYVDVFTVTMLPGVNELTSAAELQFASISPSQLASAAR